MANEKNIVGEAIGGLIISFIVILLAPFGMVLDLIFGIIAVMFLVPIFTFSIKILGLTKSPIGKIQVIVKYGAGIITVIVLVLGEMFMPMEAGIWIILGTIIYLFSDDIIANLKKGGWTI